MRNDFGTLREKLVKNFRQNIRQNIRQTNIRQTSLKRANPEKTETENSRENSKVKNNEETSPRRTVRFSLERPKGDYIILFGYFCIFNIIILIDLK